MYQVERVDPNFEPIYRDEQVKVHYPAPRLAPETYPGNHSHFPCTLLEGNSLILLRWSPDSTLPTNVGDFDPVIDTSGGPISLDSYLVHKEVPPLSERYPLTVFGSNRNPGQLLNKFRQAGVEKAARKKLEIVPMFTGMMRGYDIVYYSKPGNYGYFLADVYQGPETTDTEIEVAILFLTIDQLAILDRSEIAYDLKLLGEVKVGKSHLNTADEQAINVPSLAHAGKEPVYADPNQTEQKPIALREVKASNRKLKELAQTEFQGLFFSYDPDDKKRKAFIKASSVNGADPTSENFIAHMKARRQFQADLFEALRPEEKMVIDPEQFRATGVDLDEHTLPRLGDIAVINFIEAMRR